MSTLATIDSSKVTWVIMQSNGAYEDNATLYCTDGDGIVVVATYSDRIELTDQGNICKTWAADADIGAVLEAAQHYLQSAYFEIFEEAQHHEGE